MRAGVLCLLAIAVVSVAAAPASWKPIGTGISASIDSTNPCRIAMAFGGYTYTLPATQGWALNTANAAGLTTKYGITSFFAAQGPASPVYAGREEGTSKIVAYLKSIDGVCSGRGVLVVWSHSSGAYVANDFLTQLAGAGTKWLPRTIYYNLDGANGLVALSTITQLFRYFPASARNAKGVTGPNWGGMSGSFTTAPNRRFLTLDGSASGCTASWCLHMVCVNKHPHSATTWGLNDVTQIDAAHPVQTVWLDTTANDLAALVASASASAPAPASATPTLQSGAPVAPSAVPSAAFAVPPIVASTDSVMRRPAELFRENLRRREAERRARIQERRRDRAARRGDEPKEIVEAEDSGKVTWHRDRKLSKNVMQKNRKI